MGSGLDWLADNVTDVQRVCWRVAGKVTQETVMRAQLREAAFARCVDNVDHDMERYDPSRGASVRTWLMSRMRWSAYDGVRRELVIVERSRRLTDDDGEQLFDVVVPDSKQHVRLDAIAIMESLDAVDREALLLRFVMGMSYEDIAQHVGLCKAGAWKRVQRALQRVKDVHDIR